MTKPNELFRRLTHADSTKRLPPGNILSGGTIDRLTTLVVDIESTLPSGKRVHEPTITIKDADAGTATVVELGDGLSVVADSSVAVTTPPVATT